MSDVILNKAESIQRCVARAREEYAAAAAETPGRSKPPPGLPSQRLCPYPAKMFTLLMRVLTPSKMSVKVRL